jgi:hypothetical protein
MVHITIAQITTRYIWEGLLLATLPETPISGVKTPVPSAKPAIKNPISPLATIADPSMSGGTR